MKHGTFRRAHLAESTAELNNPGCGWYSIYTVRLLESAVAQTAGWYCAPGEQLALLRVDIGDYRSRPLDPFALEQLRRILLWFRSTGKDVILRPLYDIEGRGMEREPASLEQVCIHVQQITEVLREFDDCIYLVQGSSWGAGARCMIPAC